MSKPAASAAVAQPAAPELIRQRTDADEAKLRESELENLRAELELTRRRAEENRLYAEVAARKGLLPVEAASALVPESQIAFSYRSSMKTNHAMRLLKEHESGYQEVDKCLACGMHWADILKAGAENPADFFRCDQREAWNEQRKARFGQKQQQQTQQEKRAW